MSWILVSSNTALQVNQKYLVDSSSGQLTLTFPASPSAGDEIIIADGGNFTQNPVTLTSVFDFSNEDSTFVLDGANTQFQFVFDGSIWLAYNVSRLSVKISDLSNVGTSQISDNDLLLFVNEDSGVFESFSIKYQDLKSSITNDAFTSAGQVVTALNAYTNAGTDPKLDVSRFGGQPSSFYLNYNNLNNTPTIPTLVSELTNDSGFISNLSAFTSDNLTEGSTNLYFTTARFNSLFGPAFADAYRQISTDFDESSLLDSRDDIVGTPATIQSATNTITVSSSDISFFQVGQNLRIFGGDVDTVGLTTAPVINSVTKNGFSGITGTSVRYRIAQFDFTTGKISPRSSQSSLISDVNFENFNQINNVQISFNRLNTSVGVLVYRQIGGSGDFVLIDVLGQKQLGTITTNIIYIDYGAFNYTPWSKKSPTNGNYISSTGTLHFPLVAPTSSRRGWVNAVVTEVLTATNQIVLNESFNFQTPVTICQNDTTRIQEAINARRNAGINSLTLNDRRYIVSRLTIPTQFSLIGKGRSTVLKKLPWSTETDNRIIRTSDTSVENVLLSNFAIDGNMQNQWLKQDTFDDYANYAIDMKQNNQTFTVEKTSIGNTVGGGIAAPRPVAFLLNLSRIEDSGMSDFFEYSPLIADDGKDVIVTNNVFKNFTSAIDLSVTDNGVFSGNAVQNVGTGVITFGSRFFISSPNVLRGPAGEFIPGPDILNSVFDAVNITLEPGTTFNSDVYKYQENGIDFDLTANRATLAFRVDKLRKVDNVEELYGEVLISGNKPIQRIIDVGLNPEEGEFKFTISGSDVDELLTTFSYSELKFAANTADPNHVGLVYNASLTEYVPSGNVVAQAANSTNEYAVTLRGFKNIALGSEVRMINHGGTPNLDNLVGTVININNALQFANPPEIGVTIQYDQNVTSAGTGGNITVENTFILAKGRIL
jgi:hypothetical protein